MQLEYGVVKNRLSYSSASIKILSTEHRGLINVNGLESPLFIFAHSIYLGTNDI